MMNKLLLLYALMISVVFADPKFYEQNLEGFGFCSANFFILSKSEDAVISHAYKQADKFAYNVAKLYYKELYNKIATKRDISKIKSTYLLRLEQEYKNLNTLSNTTYTKIGKCETFIQTVLQNQENIELMFIQAKSNVVTNRRFLESLAFTNTKAIDIPSQKILEIYKHWFETKPQRKKITKLLPNNLQFMKK